MKKEEILKGLEDLIENRKNIVDDSMECIFKHDVEVLRNAVEIIKTAQEVPVQEQSLDQTKRMVIDMLVEFVKEASQEEFPTTKTDILPQVAKVILDFSFDYQQ